MRVGTELRLILGFALAEQFSEEQGRVNPGHAEGVSSARRKRDEAIGVLTSVASELPAEDPASGAVADALGQMLHDRYADPWPGASPDPGDLDRAVGLLLSAVDAAPEPLTISYLAEALADRYHLRHDAADLDCLIVWCQQLLDSADPPDGGDTYRHELLGLALMERAAANPQTRVVDLDAAIRCLETALAALPPGHPGRASLVTSAAQACWQRLDGDDSHYGLVDQMTSYAEEAWAASPPGDQDRIELGLYVAIGIHERLRRPDAPFDIEAVSRAIEILTEIEPLLADTPSPQLTVMVLCGHFLVARGQVTGALADLNAAQPLLLRAAAEIDIDDPGHPSSPRRSPRRWASWLSSAWPSTTSTMPFRCCRAASSAPEPAPARAAMTRGTLGALLVQRAGFTASWDDLDEGIAHILASYEMTPGGHAYRIAAAMNLTAALLTRFLERGQAEDVDAARYYLTMADTLAGPTGDDVRTLMADTDVVIDSNRGLLGIADSQLGDPSALDKTVVSLRAALSRLPPGHPYDGRIRSDLGLALATRAASAAGQPADLEEAARELSTAVAALSSTHMMRPLALLRAASTLTAAAAAAVDQRLLRQAIGHLSTSLAELDPRFGGRFRFVAILGAAALTLHRHSNAPGDLDEAIRWLEQARRDLDSRSYHPQYANCLFQLALAYRSRGHAESAHQAGLAALRGRARDLLLQSGTARGIGFARLAAAEATQVAAWCFADGRTAAAVEALELGRGLILHASTCVTGLADLLAAAGHEKLAREWRDAAADPSESPWDAAIPGSAHLPGLLSGAAGLGIPDDLRARALSALAGLSAELSLLAPPSPADLAMALAETGADALIYLLGPGDGTPGRAVIVPAPGLKRGPGADRAPASLVEPTRR